MSTTRDEFEALIARDCGDLSTFGSGKNRHYLNSGVNHEWIGYQAGRRAALEEAALLCEQRRDLDEASRAAERATAALESRSRLDAGALQALRHCSVVHTCNGELERAAKAIRTLAGGTQEGQEP